MSNRDAGFKRKVEEAVRRLRQVFGTARSPVYPSEAHHRFDDKFALAELSASVALAAELQALEELGLTAEHVRDAVKWVAEDREVSLRLRYELKVDFLEERKRIETGPSVQVKEQQKGGGLFGGSSTKETTTTVSREVTEFFWTATVDWEVSLLAGAAPGLELLEPRRLLGRSATKEVKTLAKTNPVPPASHPSHDLDLTFLLKAIVPPLAEEEEKKEEGSPLPPLSVAFSINRDSDECRTPRRNPEAEAALKHFRAAHAWCNLGFQIFQRNILGAERKITSDGVKVPPNSVFSHNCFVPVAASFVLEETAASDSSGAAADAAASSADAVAVEMPTAEGGSETGTGVAVAVRETALADAAAPSNATAVLLGRSDVAALLSEQRKTIREKRAANEASGLQPSTAADRFITLAEVTIGIGFSHLGNVCEHGFEAIEACEALLHKQLVAAIGHELQPHEFDGFLRSHAPHIFGHEAFRPKPFCFAVRRPGHHPEGTLSLVSSVDGGSSQEPIQTLLVAAHSSAAAAAGGDAPPPPMTFPLSAASVVEFRGDRFLHGYVAHAFGPGASSKSLSLVARARQFSSFILLVGTLASATEFNPKAAAIVKDKDELTVPLGLETLPTPKEFKDAIASLSPEQQSFCRAVRKLQLASTTFAIAVIQIKPALEAVLNLLPDALTQEVALTQELMELMGDFQLSPDLICATQGESAPAEALEGVRERASKMRAFIDAAQEKERKEHLHELELQRKSLERRRHTPEEEDSDDDDDACELAESAPVFKQKSMSKRNNNAAPVPMPIFRGGGGRGGGGREARGAPPGLVLPSAAPPQAFAMAAQAAAAPPPPPSAPVPAPAPAATMPDVPSAGASAGDASTFDLSKLGSVLDARLDELGEAVAELRPTIIKPAYPWKKTSPAHLVGKPVTTTINEEAAGREKNRAFDLIDSLTRSGALPLDADLHVVLAATHAFENTLVDTVIQKSENPLSKLERSFLVMGSIVHRQPIANLIAGSEEADRIEAACPDLIDGSG
mmetsp:Transcript_2711/g.9870  ORF Transcript_2711/g.9870 Transcript_2711/m.9870 type:complete len:1019 (-) Transcript_2711:1160-4216(-)